MKTFLINPDKETKLMLEYLDKCNIDVHKLVKKAIISEIIRIAIEFKYKPKKQPFLF